MAATIAARYYGLESFMDSGYTAAIFLSTMWAIGILTVIYGIVSVVEVVSYSPYLGTGGAYLSFITGNIMNMKLPAAQTAAFVRERLNAMHIPYTYYEKSSNIVALIGQGSPCIMLRSDMDALPVEERTGLPYAFVNGNMHACGHDMHCATLLRAAKLLKAHEAELRGTVKLLFQSGEEIFAGANAAIAEGVLENPIVDAAFAMHVGGNFDSGVIAWGDTVMSSAYGFKIKLRGKGTHGSTPELGIDPINTAVHVYLALQELIAREVAAGDECALTIGRFSAGNAANVIPETAELEGTLRRRCGSR